MKVKILVSEARYAELHEQSAVPIYWKLRKWEMHEIGFLHALNTFLTQKASRRNNHFGFFSHASKGKKNACFCLEVSLGNGDESIVRYEISLSRFFQFLNLKHFELTPQELGKISGLLSKAARDFALSAKRKQTQP